MFGTRFYMKRDASDSGLAAQNGLIILPQAPDARLEEQDWEQIQRFMAPGHKLSPTDIYAFRTIPSGDGLDFYFTRQSPKTSLKNFVGNLRAGQSLLGSHNINTFAYGLSYDAELVPADRDASWYEGTFYSKYNRPDLATANVVTSKSYMIRGAELNGQRTDDLIRGMEAGVIRKISVSFSVGQYQCGIDGRDMLAGWTNEGNAAPVLPESGCRHFPGVDYRSDGLAWAWMNDGDLMEQSLVYKNASPSAMLIRKAEVMAVRGLFAPRDKAAIEERIATGMDQAFRLPAFEKSVFAGVRFRTVAEPKEDSMPEPIEPEVEPTEPVAEPAPETEPVAEPAETAPDAPVEEPETVTEPVEEPGVEPVVTSGEPEARAAIADRGAVIDLTNRIAAYEARERALTVALGGQRPTASLLTEMRRDADLGKALFDQQVSRAVQERARAQGEGFSADAARRYRDHLSAARTPSGSLDVEFVADEIATWSAAKEALFTPGRQVLPREIPAPTPAERRRAPQGPLGIDADADNVFKN